MQKVGLQKTRIGDEYQAIRYPVYKPDKLPWAFCYENAEKGVLKAKLQWQPNVC